MLEICIFSVDDKYANEGKLGAAVIGHHTSCDVSSYFLCIFTFLNVYSSCCRKGSYHGLTFVYAKPAWLGNSCMQCCKISMLIHSVF